MKSLPNLSQKTSDTLVDQIVQSNVPVHLGIMELVSLLILVLVVVAALIASKFTHSGDPYPFTQKKALFTQVETAFLNFVFNSST